MHVSFGCTLHLFMPHLLLLDGVITGFLYELYYLCHRVEVYILYEVIRDRECVGGGEI